MPTGIQEYPLCRPGSRVPPLDGMLSYHRIKAGSES